MTRKIVAVCPSLVDISITLPDDRFARFCQMVGVTAGEWREIVSEDDFRTLLTELDILAFEEFIMVPQSHFTVIVGGSTLSMLAALEPAVRCMATYVSVLASRSGMPTPVANFFAREVRAMGILHSSSLVDGTNPTGLVIAGKKNPEKILLFYPGVSRSSAGIELHTLAPDLLIVDAYGLQQGDLAEMLHRCIEARRFRVAVSLGNHVILAGKTLCRLLEHIRMGRLFAIAGNLSEYRKLMPDVPECHLTHLGFCNHPLRRFVPFSLLTMGEGGMVANWRNISAAADAVPVRPEDIVNTSGAGDAAAGIFFAGAINDKSANETLARAAQVASRVLKVPGSLVLG